ncbi:MAG: MarR family winged helix-turn-helix transcriptional regulator, partial [Anaerovoracaceae bacterium]
EFLKISKPSATSVIKKLAKLGFVEKSPDGSDERTTYAKITKRGRLMCAYQRQYRNSMALNVADTLTGEEYEGFKKGLRNLNMFFEESIEHTEKRGKNR